jgi:tetratricopeptide (TPR) repeat protein
MIVGSPGETMTSLQRSLGFVREAGPAEVIFNPFTLLPGTREWERAVQSGRTDSTCFFKENFFELQPLASGSGPDAADLRDWLLRNSGLQQVRPFSVSECRESVGLFPNLALAHLDLANALLHAGEYEAANQAAQEALDADHPLPALCRNVLACSAARQGKLTILPQRNAGPLAEVQNQDCHWTLCLIRVLRYRAFGASPSGPENLRLPAEFSNRPYNKVIIKAFSAGCSKISECKAYKIIRNEAYFCVRRNDE